MSEIERFDLTPLSYEREEMSRSDDGDWVKIEDHLSIVDDLNSELQKYRSICSEFQEELKEAGLNG